jgi:hypothetical protein
VYFSTQIAMANKPHQPHRSPDWLTEKGKSQC